jgi:hypothetical protein
MMTELSNELRDYLKRCGLRDDKVACCESNTRMYHDLGFYGDTAEACMEMLVNRYRVDLTGFGFGRYFPAEFVGKSMLTRTLLWIVPFAAKAVRRREEYLPLTLEMIDRMLQAKRWR